MPIVDRQQIVWFTFHYVSIKSALGCKRYMYETEFTFHYVSIKSLNTKNITAVTFNLHSTMYLLNPSVVFTLYIKMINLHSTMYLLNRVSFIASMYYFIFTFHYVSIKSRWAWRCSLGIWYLHSTMYLLNLESSSKLLTVHYIYIPLCIY